MTTKFGARVCTVSQACHVCHISNQKIESLRERKRLWEHAPTGEGFQSVFDSSSPEISHVFL